MNLIIACGLCSLVQQIRDEMKTFVLAGHETSASMLNWSLFELMGNKNLMAKVCRANRRNVLSAWS